MTDKEKLNAIRAEVEEYINAARKAHTNITESNFAHLLSFIDSLQEESVSEDLEEASKNYASNNTPWDDCKDEIQESFKAGAKWQKEQMLEKAFNGYVIEDVEEGNGDFLLSCEYLPKNMRLVDQQKVKVIVIKEN